ncbi:hypothetical protein N7471_001335 [Penicillium samsonianum]|uniref:uncharacterized protein n=1 Tax=Penicillium samsonianum TaxID=1882272 RepID=UPI0025475922|nr:uncharacterized protein N7471_001335 [Penicillium samsonianum]KAJ6150136.1 hypothetical protein N7471_001335 [Penicillium samsonianum]
MATGNTGGAQETEEQAVCSALDPSPWAQGKWARTNWRSAHMNRIHVPRFLFLVSEIDPPNIYQPPASMFVVLDR